MPHFSIITISPQIHLFYKPSKYYKFSPQTIALWKWQNGPKISQPNTGTLTGGTVEAVLLTTTVNQHATTHSPN